MYFMLEAAATDSLIAVLMSNTMPFIIVLGVMYFMLISPQKKREKRLQELRNTLEIGDGVVTAGGIVGRVISIKEDTVVIESASSKIRVKRWAISDVEKLDA